MRRVLAGIFALLCIFSIAVAEESGSIPKTQLFKGRVESVTLGNAAAGVSAELAVVDDTGVSMSFAVKSPYNISKKNGLMIKLKDLMKDSAVVVEYIANKEGVNRVITIITAD